MLSERAGDYVIGISTLRSTIKVNKTSNTSSDTTMNDENLEYITSFKYLEATLSKDGTCTAAVRIRIVMAMADQGEQNEQQQFRHQYERRKAGRGYKLQVLGGNPVQVWYLYR
ncbi:hypothetical protein DPMN_069857 [Dreissena polymorpha]|uniref:Uncharacterized protein n=1 Tax=Dreissena polymorpha TaxID=45954 RepID=A0A9D3Z290_DREPO|nr:hypothetical protein DPMN_069857 [Dreissena polymorpha]